MHSVLTNKFIHERFLQFSEILESAFQEIFPGAGSARVERGRDGTEAKFQGKLNFGCKCDAH